MTAVADVLKSRGASQILGARDLMSNRSRFF